VRSRSKSCGKSSKRCVQSLMELLYRGQPCRRVSPGSRHLQDHHHVTGSYTRKLPLSSISSLGVDRYPSGGAVPTATKLYRFCLNSCGHEKTSVRASQKLDIDSAKSRTAVEITGNPVGTLPKPAPSAVFHLHFRSLRHSKSASHSVRRHPAGKKPRTRNGRR